MIGPFYFPVKFKMALFLFVNRDFHSGREPRFSKMSFLIYVEREVLMLYFFVNYARTVLFSVKGNLYPP